MSKARFDFNSLRVVGESFMTLLTAKLIELGIPADTLTCDHLCFRVGTLEEYGFYKMALSNYGELLTEAMIGGRPISTFRLASSFQTGLHEIPLLELPAPKSGKSYDTGFEHAEFVINECFTTFQSKYPHLNFEEGGNQSLNPELGLKLGQGMQAKFHHLTLDRVIELEEAKIKDIIFDFDGTLIKSRENIYEINRIVFSKVLGREVSLQESIDNYHPEFSKLFEAYALTCSFKRNEAIESWGTVSSQFSYDLFEGVLETLDVLKRHGFRLHLWTARDENSAREVLKQHGIEGFFTTMSFATEIDSKPHANSLRFNWKEVSRNQVLVIGDSPADIIGAKNIAAIGGAALWDIHSKRSPLIATGAELLFYKITDFKDWVLNSLKASE